MDIVYSPLYHKEYYAINRGAHRKGGFKIDTPVLTQHIGLWFSKEDANSGQTRSDADYLIYRLYEKCRNYVDFRGDNLIVNCESGQENKCFLVLYEYVFEIIDDCILHVKKEKYKEYSGVSALIESDNRIIEFSFKKYNLSIMFRIEIHTEYLSVSTFVSFVNGSDDCSNSKWLKLAFEFLEGMPIERGSCREDVTDRYRKCFNVRNTGRFNKILYNFIWNHLYVKGLGIEKMVLKREGALLPPMGRHDHWIPEKELNAKIFCDFRGVTLAASDAKAPYSDNPTADILKKFKRKFNPLDPINSIDNNGKKFKSAWPTKILDIYWSFLLSYNREELRKKEFAVSFMLQKRAIYISALGPQPINERGQAVPVPLHYLIFTRPVNKWQLGRLFDQIHNLGTVRLAALMELEKIRKAGRNLKLIEGCADQARQAIHDKNLDIALENFRKINKLLSHDFSMEAELDDNSVGDKNFWSGILYRTERSRYYVGIFRSLVKQVQIQPIKGFLSYERFVEARLGRIFDYIDRVGRRQERAINNSSTIFQAICVLEGERSNKKIENIQGKADFALFIFLVPYYILGFLVHIIEYGSDFERADQILRIILLTVFGILIYFGFGGFVENYKNISKDEGVAAMGRRIQNSIIIGGLIFILAFSLTFRIDEISLFRFPPEKKIDRLLCELIRIQTQQNPSQIQSLQNGDQLCPKPGNNLDGPK